MKYYSTSHNTRKASLKDAVMRSVPDDGGLYLPCSFPALPRPFFANIASLTLQEMSYAVAYPLFGGDVDRAALKEIVDQSLNFDMPLTRVEGDIYSLELYHGPTAAFKDVGARFMARLMGYFTRQDPGKTVTVLAATSGDTGGAVANGFLGVPGVRVLVLYPKGRVSRLQEALFTTLGQNITALEVNGTFDDCQELVKTALHDPDLNQAMTLSCANSINVARLLPQTFSFFQAYARLAALGQTDKDLVVAVPCGNLGNITAAVVAMRMGLPVKRLIAATNRNDALRQYLLTGRYTPRTSTPTIASAMDVGDPSNFPRLTDIYSSAHQDIRTEISCQAYTDEQISQTIAQTYSQSHYLLDPHGATAFRALSEGLRPGEVGVLLETAHPAKFKDVVEAVIGQTVPVPERLSKHELGLKTSIPLPTGYAAFKKFLLSQAR